MSHMGDAFRYFLHPVSFTNMVQHVSNARKTSAVESSFAPQSQGLKGVMVHPGVRAWVQRGGTGYRSWSLWDSDTGSDTWTCGIGLGLGLE